MMTSKTPWWTKLSKTKSISVAETERRSSNKRQKRTGKSKTPTQRLQALCIKYGISTRGNTEEIIHRLLDFIASTVVEYQENGAPECFAKSYTEAVCIECVLQEECERTFLDLRKIKGDKKAAFFKKRIREIRRNK